MDDQNLVGDVCEIFFWGEIYERFYSLMVSKCLCLNNKCKFQTFGGHHYMVFHMFGLGFKSKSYLMLWKCRLELH